MLHIYRVGFYVKMTRKMTKIEMELRGFLSKNQVLVGGAQGTKPPEANGIYTFTV